MARNLIPYGLLPNGNYGINLDNDSGDPRAAALEVLETLPAVSNADNFQGRLVFSIFNSTIFVFTIPIPPTGVWVALEGVPASIGNTGTGIDTPDVTGSEIPGELFWTLDTEVLFVWDGLQWQAAGGRYATNVIERRTVGDDIATVYNLGTTSALPSEMVEVFIDGVRQSALGIETTPGDGDYSIAGTSVIFVAPPVIGAEVYTRAYETIQLAQNARVIVPIPNPTTSAINQTEFPVGASGVELDSIYVMVAGAVKVRGVLADVVSISKALPGDTTATVVTVGAHGISVVGTEVTHIGAVETQYNGVFTVVSITDSSIYVIAVLGSDPPAATPTSDGLEFSVGDYEVLQQDTKILSISKAFLTATTATVTTNTENGAAVGVIVEFDGIENDISGIPDDPNDLLTTYNQSFEITAVSGSPSVPPFTFEIAVPAGTAQDVQVDTPDPEDNDKMFFDPPFFGDVVKFFIPFITNEAVDIRSFKNLIVAPSAGEANTLQLAPGASGESIVATPNPPILNVKGIKAGSNINISFTTTDVIITAITGANFETRIEANGPIIQVNNVLTSYVGVTDTVIPDPGNILVDLTNSGATSGRKIIIKDEGGLAGTRNIEIQGSFGATFDGVPSPYIISNDRGSVTLVYDNANNWNITAKV